MLFNKPIHLLPGRPWTSKDLLLQLTLLTTITTVCAAAACQGTAIPAWRWGKIFHQTGVVRGDGTVDGGVCFFSKDISPSNHQKLMNDSLTFQKHTFGVQKFALFCFLVVENWDLTSTRKNWSTTNLVDLAQKGTNAPKATWVFLIEMG